MPYYLKMALFVFGLFTYYYGSYELCRRWLGLTKYDDDFFKAHMVLASVFAFMLLVPIIAITQ